MPTAALQAFEVRLFRKTTTSSADYREVPASGATLTVALQGAIVSSATTCAPQVPTTLTLSFVGALARGLSNPVVYVNGGGGRMLSVLSVAADGSSISVINDQSDIDIPVAAGDRLFIATSAPPVYADAAGTSSIPANTPTLDSDGVARFWCGEAVIDFVASGGTTGSARLYTDVTGGRAYDGPSVPRAKANRFRIRHMKSIASDPGVKRQIPAAGATIAVALQGATVASAVTCQNQVSTTVQIAAPGKLRNAYAGTVRVNGDTARPLTVGNVAITGDSVVLINDQTQQPIALSAGDRLFLSTSTPILGHDPTSGVTINGNTVTLDSHGEAAFSCSEDVLDYIVSGAGLPVPMLFTDVVPCRQSAERVLNAQDYASVQAAIDECPEGGRVYVPAGTYYAPTGGFVINKSIELFGDGPLATTLRPYSNQPGQPVVRLSPAASVLNNIHLHDFQVRDDGPPLTSRLAGSHGIACVMPDGGHLTTEIRIERVFAVGVGDDGFHFEGFDIAGGALVFIHGTGLEAVACLGSGFFIKNATVVEMHNCYAHLNSLLGGYCQNSQVAWYSCAFEDNCTYTQTTTVVAGDSGSVPYNATYGAQLYMNTCAPGRVESCDFESFGITDSVQRIAKSGLILDNCSGALVSNSSFYNPTHHVPPPNGAATIDTTCRGVAVLDGGSAANGFGWATILPCSFTNVGQPIAVSQYSTATSVHAQRVLKDLNAVGTPSFVSPGIAIPTRQFSTQDPSWSPNAAGQLIFDTRDNALKCWDGLAWRSLNWT